VRARLVIAGVMACVAALLAGSAAAVLGGQPDTTHPYVALVAKGHTVCSGTLLSPTVVLTAAHCFAAESGGNPLTVDVYFGPAPTPGVDFHTGTFYFDQAFTGLGNGTAHADTHDIAVVIFDSPIDPSVTGGSLGRLPTAGLSETLANNAPIDLVGYGRQGFARGGGQPQPTGGVTRLTAQTTLIAGNDAISGEFLKLHEGACFGDSGGPDFVSGTNIVLGENSFVNNGTCAGNTYSYRVDTAAARAFLSQYIAVP
jgi:trypsin